MEKTPKDALWHRAEMQVHAVVFIMLAAGMLSAAIHGGWSVVLRRPEAYVLLVVCAVLLAEVLQLWQRGRSATPRWLLPLLLAVGGLAAVSYGRASAFGWLLSALVVNFIRLSPRAATGVGFATLVAGASLLAASGEPPVVVLRTFLWSASTLGLLAILFHAVRQVNAEAARARQLLQASVDAMGHGLSVVAPDGRVVFFNERLCALLDLPLELMRRQPRIDEVVAYQRDHGHFGKDLELVHEGGREYVASMGTDLKASPRRYLRRTHNGRTIDVQTRWLGDGSLVRTYNDVTHYEQARLAAESAAEAKAQFLANMSHELRTPLSSMLGLQRLLRDTPLDATQRDYVQKLERTGRSLLALVNDILDLSKIEAGQMPIARDHLVVGEFMRDIRAVAEALLGDSPVELRFRIGDDVPSVVVGDGLRLRQVLVNLIGNAIKFTPKGRVTVVVERRGSPHGDVTLRWSVTDTGIGIAPEHQQRIFEGFSQADASISRSYGGTGLGLAISQRLLQLMDSTLSVRSAPGEGSTFWFDVDLPVQNDAPSTWPPELRPAAATGPRLKGLRVLLAEDEPINRLVAQQLLEREGAVVRAATNGSEAVTALTAGASEFDCVLMDMQMPELDGLAATRHIRVQLGLAELPIYALTANVLDAEREACFAAGMNGHIGKPFDLERVVEVLRVHGRAA